MTNKFIRAKTPDDPNRCKGNSLGGDGRCPFMAVQTENGVYLSHCPRHGGMGQLQIEENKEKSLYSLNKWTQRVKRFEKHDEARTITAELAMLRLLLEKRFQQCESDLDLIYNSGGISDLVMKIGELVKSISKLEKQNGEFIDKAGVERLADSLLNIVIRFISDPDTLQRICDEFAEELENTKNANRPIQRQNPERSDPQFDENLHQMGSEE